MSLLLSLFLAPASAQTEVCQTCLYTEVQLALLVDDDIEISDSATYAPFTVFGGPSVTVTAIGGATPTIEANFLAPAVTVEANASLTLQDIQVDGADVDRGIVVKGGAALDMIRGDVANGLGGRGGGIWAQLGSTITLTDVTVHDCFSSNSPGGGGLYAQGATVTLTDTTFTNNAAWPVAVVEGGGIATVGGDLVITGGTFTSNDGGLGGALHATGGAVSIVDTTFELNTGLAGGAVYLHDSAALVASGTTTWSTNSAYDSDLFVAGSGGAIHAGSGTTVDLTGPTVSLDGNAAEVGGAMFLGVAATLTATDVSFLANSTQSAQAGDLADGGALYAEDALSVSLDTCTFDGNSAHSTIGAGGHIAAKVTPVVITGGTYSSGTAGLGGAVWFSSPGDTLFADNARFEFNEASTDGGALFVSGATVLDTLEVIDNHALGGSGYGGGARVDGGSLFEIVAGEWSDNTADRGGAVYVESVGDVSLADTWLHDHSASEGGAAYILNAGQLVVSDTLFERNEATGTDPLNFGGGALRVDGFGPVTVERTTFIDSTSATFGGVMELFGAGPTLLDDVIVSGATAARGGGVDVFGVNDLTVARSTFCGTTGSTEGGALLIEASCGTRCLVTNSVFFDNTSPIGAGVHAVASDVALSQSTFLQMSSALGGAIAHTTNGASVVADGVIADGVTGVAFGATGGTSMDLTRTNVTGTSDPLTNGAVLGTPTALPPQFLIGDPDPSACGVEFRIHPDSPLAASQLDPYGIDLGAFDGPEAHPDTLLDVDGDGSPTRYDCLTDDAAAGGLSDEICDGIDNDCDGLVDDDDPDADFVVSYWYDGDGDGWGSLGGCVPGPGWVDQGGDCNDDDPTVHPGVEDDDCNGTDDDCDGQIDEDPGDNASWYGVDFDGDGFLGGIDAVRSCTDLPGRVEQPADFPLDCDDDDDRIYPGARDAPDDGIDQDCSGADTVTWVQGGACGCTSAPGGAGGAVWFGLLALAGARRRS